MAEVDYGSGVGARESLKHPRDIVALLAEEVAAVRAELSAGTIEKARTIGYLARVALKAIEVGDLAARLEALESILKRRSAE